MLRSVRDVSFAPFESRRIAPFVVRPGAPNVANMVAFIVSVSIRPPNPLCPSPLCPSSGLYLRPGLDGVASGLAPALSFQVLLEKALRNGRLDELIIVSTYIFQPTFQLVTWVPSL